MESLSLTGGDFSYVLKRLSQGPAVLVVIEEAQGSVPRETGAWMAVFADTTCGTIGGGRLEWEAEAEARQMLVTGCTESGRRRIPLGPHLGQCCGGVVTLGLFHVTTDDAPVWARRWHPGTRPLALFGGGHVGRAIVQALCPLPFTVHWIDSRDGVFPSSLPPQVHAEHSDPVHQAVPELPAGSQVLIMSFSHAEDLDIVAACLDRQRARADLPFIGLIGSRTKWATFRHRLEARGYTETDLAQVTCPIGLPGITGKAPEVIAASVVAQLLLESTP